MRGVSDGVDYKSFFLWATESASRVQAVGDKLRTMVANLARKEGNMDCGPILRAFDPSETNRITKKSLKGGLNKLRLELSDSEIDVLMGHFTTDEDGNIQYEMYTSFVFDEEGHSPFQRLTNRKKSTQIKTRHGCKRGSYRRCCVEDNGTRSSKERRRLLDFRAF